MPKPQAMYTLAFFPCHNNIEHRMIEEHPEESIIISQLQSLHILFGCKLNSDADADAVNLSIDNKIPTIPTIPTIIPSHGTS